MDLKNGLFEENGKRLFYKDGKPYHAGAIEWDGRIYYIGKGGEAVTGEHIVHREMGNGILERGTYTFGEDGVLLEGSFRAPRVSSRKRKHKRKRTKRRSAKRMTKKNRQRLFGVLAAAAVLIAAVVTVMLLDQQSSVPTDGNPAQGESDECPVQLPVFEESVRLCSDEAYAYYRGELALSDAVAGGEPYRPLRFEYDLYGQSGRLFISETEDMSDADEFLLAADATVLTVDNLKTDTVYYYRAEVNAKTYDGSFRTAEGTRFITLPGAVNVRDIGGWKTADGSTVRQGMIIRGAELDGLANPSYYPREEAINAAMEQFGFVYDFDLRSSEVYVGDYVSRLRSAEHRFYNAPMYANAFNSVYKESVRAMFADLADETHYPMYMHCTYGLDRTGTLIYLLLGVLGVPEEELMQEYYTSCYEFDDYVDSPLIEALYDGLQTYPGDMLKEKIEAFLITDIGVTEEELTSIRRLLLERP